jgi:glycine betaine/proline transport system substrate-binding protein
MRWKLSAVVGTRSLVLLALGALMVAPAAVILAPAAGAQEKLPGTGVTVQPARATWDTGWFQTGIYIEALKRLGYNVKPVETLDNPIFYQAVAQGDVDFWVNGWFPLHNSYLKDFKGKASIVGYVAKGGALQGYLIDKKTSDKYHIYNIADFKKPDVAKLFDSNGDGKANLVACPPGWGCELVIKHQLTAYGLRKTVEPIKASYSASMAQALARYQDGQPIFFYTWTPNWTTGLLKPGKDVVWLEVPFPSLPKSQEQYLDKTTVPNVAGCADNASPCKMGWPANDIRPVVNNKFLEHNPAAKKLFEEMSIPLKDIEAQNAEMYKGADKPADIQRQVNQWIESHQKTFDGWIAQAEEAAKASG